MPPTSPGTASYYLALNGAPNGPHRAAGVLELLQQGAIQGTTLICREGGAAWVPVAEMEVALRLEAMPAAPAPAPVYASRIPPVPQAQPLPSPMPQNTIPVATGYGSGGSGYSPAGRHQRDEYAAPPAERVPADVTRPIRFVTLLGALALFFLPWLELRCASVKTITQTGLQTVMSGYSVDEALVNVIKMAPKNAGRQDIIDAQAAQLEGDLAKERFSSEVGCAWFAGGAMFCVVIGLGSALGRSGRQSAGIMSLLALVCLGAQMLSDFPLQQQTEEKLKEVKKAGGTPPQQEMMMRMFTGGEMLQTAYTPWFYTELGLLGLTAFIGFTGGGRRQT